MTELVAQARARLDAAAARVGRALTLVVRVPPTLRNCRWSGLDVTQWMRRRLIDVVIPSQVMTLSHDMPLDEFVRMAAPAGCAVFGSLHGRAGYSWPFSAVHGAIAYSAEVTRAPTAAQVLGAALNQRYLGADGFELFNFGFFSVDPPMMSAVVSGLIDPRTITRGDRRYQVTPAYFHDADDTYEYRKQLPGALEPGRTLTLRLLIGEDLATADPRSACVALRFGFHGANRAYGAVTLAVRVNDRPVHNGSAAGRLIVTTGRRHGMGSHPPPTEAYLQLPIDDLTLLRPGWNTVQLTLDPATRTPPLECVEAELGVAPGR